MFACVLTYPALVTSAAFKHIITFTARITGLILGVLGTPAEANGTLVSSDDFAVTIIGECTGIVPMLIFLSAVVAYPCGIKHKLAGMGMGIVALYLLNLIRIVSLFSIGSSYPDFLETAHMVLWQGLMILLALILWLFWANRLTGEHAR